MLLLFNQCAGVGLWHWWECGDVPMGVEFTRGMRACAPPRPLPQHAATPVLYGFKDTGVRDTRARKDSIFIKIIFVLC